MELYGFIYGIDAGLSKNILVFVGFISNILFWFDICCFIDRKWLDLGSVNLEDYTLTKLLGDVKYACNHEQLGE